VNAEVAMFFLWWVTMAIALHLWMRLHLREGGQR